MNKSWMIVALLTACVGRDTEAPSLLFEEPASSARTAFFEAFLDGDYASLDGVIEGLGEEADAGDEASLAVKGFAHAWRLGESRRVLEDDVGEHASLSTEAFAGAVEARPEDPRLLGFYGAFLQAQGEVEGRFALQRNGWWKTGAAMRRWPEWGLFTRAYGLISFDPTELKFRQGVDMMWQTLDECVDSKVPRESLRWLDYLDGIDDDGDAFDVRACGNTEVVPHNIEGFFLVFGDFFAKAGDQANAKMMYQNALDVDVNQDWPWASLAEDRLARLDELEELFATEPPRDSLVPPTETLTFSGTGSCMVCHQR